MSVRLTHGWSLATLRNLLMGGERGPILQGWSPQCLSRPRVMEDEWAVNVIRALPVPLAPLAEQTVVLHALDEALSSLGRLQQVHAGAGARLRDLDSSILGEAFRGELVPQDPNGEPAEAMLARLKAVAFPVTTVAPKRRKLSQEARRDDR